MRVVHWCHISPTIVLTVISSEHTSIFTVSAMTASISETLESKFFWQAAEDKKRYYYIAHNKMKKA